MDADWTDDLLSDAREVVIALMASPMDDFEALAAEVAAYHEHVHRAARFVTDLHLADTLVTASLDLLQRASDASDEERRAVSVAVRYFVSPNDADDDLASPFGFDDDVEVFNAVASRFAPELVIVG